MKKKFLFVLLAVFVLAAISITTFAASNYRQANLYYNNIKLQINGESIIPKDAKGNVVEPFIIEGTTYLPVRAVGEALGMEVDWDAATSTVIIKDSSYSAGQTTSSDSTPLNKVLYDKDGIKITYLGIETSDSFLGGYDIKFYIENSSTQNIMVQTRNESVNGIMTTPIFSSEIAAGKSVYDKILFSESTLESSHITSIDSVEFYFHIFNADTWSTINDSDIITIVR